MRSKRVRHQHAVKEVQANLPHTLSMGVGAHAHTHIHTHTHNPHKHIISHSNIHTAQIAHRPTYHNPHTCTHTITHIHSPPSTYLHILHHPSPYMLVVKNPPASADKRCGFNPWVRKILWRRKWQSTPGFLPGKSYGQRSLESYSPWDCKELDMT